ncbi:unnamed protein product [Arctogadus glacialis]
MEESQGREGGDREPHPGRHDPSMPHQSDPNISLCAVERWIQREVQVAGGAVMVPLRPVLRFTVFSEAPQCGLGEEEEEEEEEEAQGELGGGRAVAVGVMDTRSPLSAL